MNAQQIPAESRSHLAMRRRDHRAPGPARHLDELVIGRLTPDDLPAVEAHLLALGPADRSSRFHCLLGDDAILDYVARIDFTRMILVGAFDEATEELVGLGEAHLDAPTSPLRAEVSVSVLARHRGQSLGRLLVAIALDIAAGRGTRRADFYFQIGNRAIARLIRALSKPIATAPGYASIALPLAGSALH